jgi:hypothetical protein
VDAFQSSAVSGTLGSAVPPIKSLKSKTIY